MGTILYYSLLRCITSFFKVGLLRFYKLCKHDIWPVVAECKENSCEKKKLTFTDILPYCHNRIWLNSISKIGTVLGMWNWQHVNWDSESYIFFFILYLQDFVILRQQNVYSVQFRVCVCVCLGVERRGASLIELYNQHVSLLIFSATQVHNSGYCAAE